MKQILDYMKEQQYTQNIYDELRGKVGIFAKKNADKTFDETKRVSNRNRVKKFRLDYAAVTQELYDIIQLSGPNPVLN